VSKSSVVYEKRLREQAIAEKKRFSSRSSYDGRAITGGARDRLETLSHRKILFASRLNRRKRWQVIFRRHREGSRSLLRTAMKK
jgi:hypothetical protein